MSCGAGCRRGLEPVLLWLWGRPVAAAPFGPLAWEPPCAAGAAVEKAKDKKKKEEKISSYSFFSYLELHHYGHQSHRELYISSCLVIIIFIGCSVTHGVIQEKIIF